MSEKAVIRAFANGGEAVGTLDSGKTVFVRGAVPGEVVSVEIFQDKKRYARAKLLEVISAGASCRIESDCPYFPACPGCSYRHIPYDVELAWKQKQLEYLLREFEEVRYESPVGASARSNWRNKLTLHVENSRCGYRSDDNVSIIDIDSCCLAQEQINEHIGSIDRSADGSVTLRCTGHDGVVCVLRGKANKKILTEAVGDFGSFKVRADGFFQTNPEIAGRLLAQVVVTAEKSNYRELYELYCGVGVFSTVCAERIPDLRCVGVELVKEAVILSRNNAANHGVSEKCRFFEGDAGTFFQKHAPDNGKYLLLVDPPRTGMDKNMISGIMKHAPQEIISISCAADTLARDVKALSSLYRLESVRLFDMFPGTAHFETFSVLKLRDR